MNFKSLYKILIENEEYAKFSEYDSWTDFLDFERDNEIQSNLVDEFVTHFSLSSSYYFNKFYLNIRDKQYSYWFELNDDVYSLIAESDEEMKDHAVSIPEHVKLELLGITEDNLYISGWECTIGDMKQYGGTVYHYTTEEKWEKIKKSKILYGSSGTGLTNRHVSGIFSSVSPETYADGTYGDVMLSIDLTNFKKEENIDELFIEPEPDVMEAAIDEAFLGKLDIEDYSSYVSSDMSPETIIINHNIPIKYISVE